MKNEKHYFINLTNGIEKVSQLQGEKVSFLRIRSTTVERKDWIHLFNDLDHNFLMSLAMGEECVFVDYGTNRKNSKTCYYAIPLIKYILCRRWGLEAEIPYRLQRHSDDKVYDVERYFDHIYNELFVWNQNKEKESVKTKINYYKRFVMADKLKLSTLSESTVHDGDFCTAKYAEGMYKLGEKFGIFEE